MLTRTSYSGGGVSVDFESKFAHHIHVITCSPHFLDSKPVDNERAVFDKVTPNVLQCQQHVELLRSYKGCSEVIRKVPHQVIRMIVSVRPLPHPPKPPKMKRGLWCVFRSSSSFPFLNLQQKWVIWRWWWR